MKKLSILFCTVFLIVCFSGPGGATPVFLTGVDEFSGFSDVEQTRSNDCWAAASSNMLAYSGWDGGFADASAIYGEFTSSWNNQYGNPYYGIEWWFDGSAASQGDAGWPQHSEPGFAYYSNALFNANHAWGEEPQGVYTEAQNWIEGNVLQDRAFAMLLGTESGGIHWLTGYGYDNAAGTNGVWAADSLDGAYDLSFYELTFTSGRWFMDYSGHDDWFILAMDRLAPNSAGVVANIRPGDDDDDDDDDINPPVPEPATILLFGLGLLGLAGVSRRKE